MMETKHSPDNEASTLDQLIYDVRHTIGDVKDEILTVIANRFKIKNRWPQFSYERLFPDPTLTSYRRAKYLQEKQSEFVKLLGEIRKDELIKEYLKPDEIQDLLLTIISPMEDRITELDSTLDIKGLVQLSELSIKLYNRLKPIADKTKHLERKTKLYTEDHFKESMKEHIEQYIGSTTGQAFSIGVVDLNSFKKCNDHLSHEYGDEIIKQFAGSMKKTLEGVLARSSAAGDEFYVLMPVEAESLKTIIHERFFKDIELNLGERVLNSWKESGHRYDDRFDKFARKLTCAVGISSPQLNGKSLFQRVYERMDDQKDEYKILKEKLAEGMAAGLPEYKIYKSLDDHQRELLKDKLVFTLKNEADETMYVAKKRAKEAHALGNKISMALTHLPAHTVEFYNEKQKHADADAA